MGSLINSCGVLTLSYVPQSALKPVNALNLRSFTITESLTGKTYPYFFDSATLYQGYLRATTIRNLSGTAPIYYRTQPGDPYDVIAPNSERTIQGWNSLIELNQETGQAISGVIIYEIVKFQDAFNNGQ